MATSFKLTHYPVGRQLGPIRVNAQAAARKSKIATRLEVRLFNPLDESQVI